MVHWQAWGDLAALLLGRSQGEGGWDLVAAVALCLMARGQTEGLRRALARRHWMARPLPVSVLEAELDLRARGPRAMDPAAIVGDLAASGAPPGFRMWAAAIAGERGLQAGDLTPVDAALEMLADAGTDPTAPAPLDLMARARISRLVAVVRILLDPGDDAWSVIAEEAVAGFRAGGLAEEELVTLALLDAWQMAVQGRNAPCSRPAAILVAALEQLGSDRARLPWGAPAPTPGV